MSALAQSTFYALWPVDEIFLNAMGQSGLQVLRDIAVQGTVSKLRQEGCVPAGAVHAVLVDWKRLRASRYLRLRPDTQPTSVHWILVATNTKTAPGYE